LHLRRAHNATLVARRTNPKIIIFIPDRIARVFLYMYFGKTRDGLKLWLLCVVIPSAGDDKFIAHAPALPLKHQNRSCVCAPVNKKWKYIKLLQPYVNICLICFVFHFIGRRWEEGNKGKRVVKSFPRLAKRVWRRRSCCKFPTITHSFLFRAPCI
jgi:hypothetical protein